MKKTQGLQLATVITGFLLHFFREMQTRAFGDQHQQ